MSWMSDDDFHAAMQECWATVRVSMVDERDREQCADNPKQYYGSPCKRCGGTRRYLSSNTCVSCARAASKEQTDRQREIKTGVKRVKEEIDPLVASMPDPSKFKLGDRWVPPTAKKPKPLGRRDPRITAANLTLED